MVNTGGPSKGCRECKRHKVKCDEAEPECQHCLAAGRRCSGYTDSFTARIRYETGTGKRKYTRKNGTTAVARRLNSDSLETPVPTSDLPRNEPSTEDGIMLEAALLLFKEVHITSYDSTKSPDTFIDSFTRVLNESADGSSLRKAVLAVAYALYSFTKRSPEMKTRSEMFFGEAVSLTRFVLDDPQESQSDATLLTVLLLSMFENFDSVKTYRPPFVTHHAGLGNLLLCRSTVYLQDDISRFCIRQYFDRLAATVLGGDLSIMKELLHIADMLTLPNRKTPGCLLPFFVTSLARLRRQIEEINLCSNFDTKKIRQILMSATKEEETIAMWPGAVTPTCHPKNSPMLLSASGFDLSEYASGWADRYPSLAVAQDWNHYRYLRLMLNLFISRCAAMLRDYAVAASADKICEEMIDGVCASVLFYTGPLQEHLGEQGNNSNTWSTDDEVYETNLASATIGAMLLLPKLRWILQSGSSFTPKQGEWLRLHVNRILHFYQTHGVENLETYS